VFVKKEIDPYNVKGGNSDKVQLYIGARSMFMALPSIETKLSVLETTIIQDMKTTPLLMPYGTFFM
jgi:hypothetical protein